MRGASPIRKQLGIGLKGEGNLLELRQALYRCDDLYERIPIGKGRHYHVADGLTATVLANRLAAPFDVVSVALDQPEEGVAPGQACVFYEQQEFSIIVSKSLCLLTSVRYGYARYGS